MKILFTNKLPISRTTLIKLLLVLAYTQLLITQMDNRKNLETEVNRLTSVPSSKQAQASYWFSSSYSNELSSPSAASKSSCCGSSKNEDKAGVDEEGDNQLSAWFNCMWTSAKACSGAERKGSSRQLVTGGKNQEEGLGKSRAMRFIEFMYNLMREIYNYQVKCSRFIMEKLQSLAVIIPFIWRIWITRWRSPIIQRLCQSMLVHFIYITSLLLANDEHLEDE